MTDLPPRDPRWRGNPDAAEPPADGRGDAWEPGTTSRLQTTAAELGQVTRPGRYWSVWHQVEASLQRLQIDGTDRQLIFESFDTAHEEAHPR